MRTLLTALTLALSLLSGCSSVRLVDAQVQAVSTLPAGETIAQGARFRFERLPLQATQLGTEQLEAMAQTALERVGLVRDDAQAQYSVLLGVRVSPYLVDTYGRPMSGLWGPGYGQFMIGSGGSMMGWGMRYPPSPLYRREVSLLLRDLRSSQVVYETRAVNDNPWSDSNNVLAALFEAALQDFPNPPQTVRQINIEIPR